MVGGDRELVLLRVDGVLKGAWIMIDGLREQWEPLPQWIALPNMRGQKRVYFALISAVLWCLIAVGVYSAIG